MEHLFPSQSEFFRHVKSLIPSHISLVDELADTLSISADSVYRRIRGEKELSIGELQAICQRFGIAMDGFLELENRHIPFATRYLHHENFHFNVYLEEMLKTFRHFQQYRQKEMIYLTKDYPIYHYFQFPEIASFKYFFWMKTYMNFPEMQKQKFRMGYFLEALARTGKEIASLYAKMPSVEIHNPDNILTTLRQIEYYKESHFFENAADTERVYDSLCEMVDHMEEQALHGKKFLKGVNPHPAHMDYHVYVTDFFIGDNTQLVTLDGRMICYKVVNGINYISTSDPEFCRHTREFIDMVISKSAYISSVGEKQRSRFFNMIRERIDAYRNNKAHSLAHI
jgi:transcriptional regulator with XRE-family HTH domain